MTHKDVFILGAGFSKAINGAMPTMDELSTEVIARLKKSPFQIQDTLHQLGNNIELWMTYLSQPQPWLKDEHHLRNKALATEIRGHINSIISERTKLSMEVPAPEWLTSLIKEWHSKRATIATLNYDTLVERAARKISVNGHEGVLAESMHPPYFSNLLARRGDALWGEERTDTFSYVNLHGSTNFYYSGRDSFYGETIFLSKVPPWGTEHAAYESYSRGMAGDKEALIIPPVTDKLTYFNNETVRRLWQEASQALWCAKRVFIIGYSLPMSDLGMQFFLQYSQPTEGTPLYVVDRNINVVSRYKEIMPKLRVKGDFAGTSDVVSDFAKAYPNLPSF